LPCSHGMWSVESCTRTSGSGTVVEIDALAEALKTGEKFVSPLRGLDNVILTPHIGGSTEEAQRNIGKEVADKLIRYSNNGSTLAAVNFSGGIAAGA